MALTCFRDTRGGLVGAGFPNQSLGLALGRGGKGPRPGPRSGEPAEGPAPRKDAAFLPRLTRQRLPSGLAGTLVPQHGRPRVRQLRAVLPARLGAAAPSGLSV